MDQPGGFAASSWLVLQVASILHTPLSAIGLYGCNAFPNVLS
jgi:hypothetical protein